MQGNLAMTLFNGLYLPEKQYTLLACAAHLFKKDGMDERAEKLLALANQTHDESGCHEGSDCAPIGFEEAHKLYEQYFNNSKGK